MEGIRRDLNNLIVQNATPISPTGGTSKITNPTAKEMGTKCGIGQVPANVIRGGRLGYEIIGSGCVDYYIAQPYLTDDNFAVIPEDIFNSGGLLSPDAIKKAQEWNELKEAYENGEATLQDLKDFDPGVLSGLDGWLDYYDDFIEIGEKAQYNEFLDAFGEAGEDADKLQSVISQYENAGIQNNSIVQSFAPAQTSGEDILKEIFGESGATIGAGVTVSIEGIGAILSGQVSFEDFVREIFILTKGILNLPIPDWLPIPAVFKLPTIGEIWDKTFGGIIGDVQDSGCLDEENAVAECAGEIGDAVVGAVGDFGKTVEGKITEVYEGIVGAVKNPEDAIQQVYDWLKGIFGEDPQNMPPWIWGVVLGGVFGKEILGGLEDIFGDDVNDDGTIGVPPITGDDFDCSSVGRIQQAGAKTEAECGGCDEGYEPKNGQCVAELDPCPGQQIRNEVSGECEDPDPGFVKGDPCKTEGGESGTRDKDGNCVATFSPPPPTQIDCTQPRPGYTPSFNPADNAAHFAWQEACGATHCPDGSEKPASGICGEQPEQTCNNGAVNAPDCNDCGDNSTPDMHEGGDCNQPLKKQQPQPCPNGATLESDCTKCPEGQDFNSVGQCAPKEITTQPPSQGFNLNVDCSNPKIGFTPSFDYAYNAAYSEYSAQYDEQCGSGGSFNCNSLNRQTREDGSCGECLPGYVLDQNMDNCVKEEVPVTPTETPTETPATGGGASVGGGAGGAFSPFLAGITYTPQPVPEVIQQPSGMFTGAQPTRNTKLVGDSIIQNLFKEYFV